jgi:hypothetical protein
MGTNELGEHICQETDLKEVATRPDYWGRFVVTTYCEVCGRIHKEEPNSIL